MSCEADISDLAVALALSVHATSHHKNEDGDPVYVGKAIPEFLSVYGVTNSTRLGSENRYTCSDLAQPIPRHSLTRSILVQLCLEFVFTYAHGFVAADAFQLIGHVVGNMFVGFVPSPECLVVFVFF